MELILPINGIWVSPGHLPSREVHVQILLEQLLRLYRHIHACTYIVPIKIPVTLSEHCISHSARFKNTVIEILKTSTDPQISKGVDTLKQLLFLKKRRIQFPVVVLASKIACALNPRSRPRWNRHLVNSAAPRGQLKVCLFPE